MTLISLQGKTKIDWTNMNTNAFAICSHVHQELHTGKNEYQGFIAVRLGPHFIVPWLIAFFITAILLWTTAGLGLINFFSG